MRRSPFLAAAAALSLLMPAAAHAGPDPQPGGPARLLARAVLPARTFARGPASGTLLGDAPINGVTAPFPGQPVRVETFGDHQENGDNDVHWLKVQVAPRTREVFSYQPQIVPGNRTAVPAP